MKYTRIERSLFDRLQALQGNKFNEIHRAIEVEQFGSDGQTLVLPRTQFSGDLAILNKEFENVFYCEGRGIVIFD